MIREGKVSSRKKKPEESVKNICYLPAEYSAKAGKEAMMNWRFILDLGEPLLVRTFQGTIL